MSSLIPMPPTEEQQLAEKRLAAVKAYCRIDHDNDDELVRELISSAEAYLEDAGVPSTASEDPRYRLCVKAMVLKWYDAREVETIGTISSPAELGIRMVLNQLKLVYGFGGA